MGPKNANFFVNYTVLFFFTGRIPISVFKIVILFVIHNSWDSWRRIHLCPEGGKASSPAQLPNLILPICGSARPQRASEPPPNSLREGSYIYNLQFLL